MYWHRQKNGIASLRLHIRDILGKYRILMRQLVLGKVTPKDPPDTAGAGDADADGRHTVELDVLEEESTARYVTQRSNHLLRIPLISNI